jgi:hypothetical protein
VGCAGEKPAAQHGVNAGQKAADKASNKVSARAAQKGAGNSTGRLGVKSIQTAVTVRGGEGRFARSTQYAVTVEQAGVMRAFVASTKVANGERIEAFGDSVEEAVDNLSALLRR